MPAGRFERVRLSLQRSALLGLSRLARARSGGSAGPAHQLTGERGELEALFFLRREGFVVVERRWRSPEHQGDVDLIAWEGEALCFVEVKTRTRRDRTPALSAVDRGKRRMLQTMAWAYARTLPAAKRDGVRRRFDVLSVYLLEGKVEFELLRDAFGSG